MQTVYPAGHQAPQEKAPEAQAKRGAPEGAKSKIVDTEIKYKIAKAILAGGGKLSHPRECAKGLGLHATSMHYVLKIWNKHLVSHVSRDGNRKAVYEFAPAFLEQTGAEVAAWEAKA